MQSHGVLPREDQRELQAVSPSNQRPYISYDLNTNTATSSTLWLCIYMSQLSLDALAQKGSNALIVTEESSGRIKLHACNQAALDHGIKPGMTLSAALSLYKQLDMYPRDCLAEQCRLNRLAAWALSISDKVSLYSSDSTVVEIKGSLRLFGGVHALLSHIKKELNRFGYSHTISIAPTPLAAFWLAQSGVEKIVLSTDTLTLALHNLPISLITKDKKRLSRLQHSGIHTLADLMRLPRDGVARRFGATTINTLDKAMGQQAEPLEPFTKAENFYAVREFYLPSHDLNMMKPMAIELLREFEDYLCQRQAATQHFQCILKHQYEPATVIDVGFSRYSGKSEHLFSVLEEHLTQLRLIADVVSIGIYSNQIDVLVPKQSNLFENTTSDGQSWHQLIDQLKARLGKNALQYLSVCADYRPEKAFSLIDSEPNNKKNNMRLSRPLCLLVKPEPLFTVKGYPQWQGPLRLSQNVERIEQGWWDGRDIKRDYYAAHNPVGSKLWVYLDRRQKCWFLHGVFA